MGEEKILLCFKIQSLLSNSKETVEEKIRTFLETDVTKKLEALTEIIFEEKKEIYLRPLDMPFQDIYEACTDAWNEQFVFLKSGYSRKKLKESTKSDVQEFKTFYNELLFNVNKKELLVT